MTDVTDGTLLGGRVRYRQPKEGFRSGIEPVLVAAAVPARAGQSILEVGTGAGAGLLCLAARVPGIAGTGIDIDPAAIALARDNAAANGMALRFEISDIGTLDREAVGTVDHAFANPPYHPPGGTASPSESRRRAKQADVMLLPSWVRSLASVLRSRGTLTLIVPAAAIPRAFAALASERLGGIALCPLWPREGTAARLIIVQGTRGSRAPARLVPGLVLHRGMEWTEAAKAILWAGAPLGLAPARPSAVVPVGVPQVP